MTVVEVETTEVVVTVVVVVAQGEGDSITVNAKQYTSDCIRSLIQNGFILYRAT